MRGEIVKVSGPLVVAAGLGEARLGEAALIGKKRLVGEILDMAGDTATLQVYGETAGLGPGAEVVLTGALLSAELGPGLIASLFDGIGRPVLDRERRWAFSPTVTVGRKVGAGDVVGTVQETDALLHKIMVPPGVQGTVAEVHSGERTVAETVVIVRDQDGVDHKITLIQRWPIRLGRPYHVRTAPTGLLHTGQERVDALFPLRKGGTAAVAGPSGSGKTKFLCALAEKADVDVVVYIGCGMRGNEIAALPTERTVRVVSTADMPPAMREASVYTGLAIAEYYRDMGYEVAVIADTLDFGDLAARFYGRAGVVQCLGAEGRRGSLAAIGAVSSPCPAMMRLVRAFWKLGAGADLEGRSFYADSQEGEQ